MEDRLRKQGVSEDEIKRLLEQEKHDFDKYQDLLQADEAAQEEELQRRLAARRKKKGNIQAKVNEASLMNRMQENKLTHEMEEIRKEIEQNWQEEEEEMKREEEEGKRIIQENLMNEKRDRLKDFEKRIDKARGTAEFEKVL